MHPERRPNRDRSPEALEARLRALPQPLVPADLEARLLANIPRVLPIPRRRWGVWAGAVGALAAACLLAVLAWSARDGKNSDPSSGPGQSATQVTPRPLDDSANITWRQARRDLDEAEMSTFTWPLPETSPIRLLTSIPPDLLD
jgi:ferric-dicitrate binding protein FerR (iron transport regulator)